MTDKLQNEHHLEFLSLTGGCTGLSESTLAKMPHCWKSHVTAHIYIIFVGEAQGCGGILNTTSGRFGSIDSNLDGLYEHNLDCRWTIFGGDNKVIQLNIEGIDIEQHPSCVYDYIKVGPNPYLDNIGLS